MSTAPAGEDIGGIHLGNINVFPCSRRYWAVFRCFPVIWTPIFSGRVAASARSDAENYISVSHILVNRRRDQKFGDSRLKHCLVRHVLSISFTFSTKSHWLFIRCGLLSPAAGCCNRSECGLAPLHTWRTQRSEAQAWCHTKRQHHQCSICNLREIWQR